MMFTNNIIVGLSLIHCIFLKSSTILYKRLISIPVTIKMHKVFVKIHYISSCMLDIPMLGL